MSNTNARAQTNDVLIIPFDADMESAVLGSIIASEDISADFSNLITEDLFHDERNKMIAQAIINLKEEYKPIDLLMVVNALRKKTTLKKAGGAVYISSLTDYILSIGMFDHHLRILQELQIRRAVIFSCNKAIQRAFDRSEDPFEIVEELASSASDKIESFVEKKEVVAYDLARDTVREIRDKLARKKVGLQTGFSGLDRPLGGLLPGKLYIIGARPAMGKSSLALNMALNVAKNGKWAYFLSLEMSNQDLMKRVLAQESGVSSSQMDRMYLSEKELISIENEASKMKDTPMIFDDSASIGIQAIRTRAKRLKRKGMLDVIFVDYLQLIRQNRADNRTRDIALGEISAGLKMLSKEINVPVIALAQLSREIEKRQNKRPQLSDLRESGNFEQDADVVMFLHRPEYYDPSEQFIDTRIGTISNKGIAVISCEKNRSGPTFESHLRFNAALTKFTNLDDQYEYTDHPDSRIEANTNFDLNNPF